METLVERCAGLDIGKADVKACIRILGTGKRRRQEVRMFATTTPALLQLRDWLAAHEVTVVGMEATGDYWKPVFYLLEDVFDCQLLNARHMRNVPGRKTDVADSAWIARLIEHGLVCPSLVPPPPIRRLRDLTRYRTVVTQERTREIQRLHRVLEDAGIKLSVFVSDILGVSGRAMLDALTARIEVEIAPFADAVDRLDGIPGINARIAQIIIAETGGDMTRFPSAGHLASWAGLCPGNNESAGKHYSGRTRRGDTWLRGALGEAASSASRSKTTYLSTHYRRIATRRGSKRALVAVSHTMLVIAWHLLHDQTTYRDLGPDYHQRRQDPERQTRKLVHQLQQLGHQVTLTASP